MFTQDLTIEYNDGKRDAVVADQRDVQELELFCLRRKISSNPGQSLFETAPTLSMRVLAWAAESRESGHKVEFERWSETVNTVIAGEVEAPDPTQQTTSAEESQP